MVYEFLQHQKEVSKIGNISPMKFELSLQDQQKAA